MPCHFYILHSIQLDKFYIGHTCDALEERLRKHISDHSGFTSKAKDWKIAYFEEFSDKGAAYARERSVKGWKSKKMITELVSRSK
jgi:putative endonuclease